MQADGYAGYNALYGTHKFQEAACWVHARRKFFEIAKSDPGSFSEQVVNHIAKLYAIEKDLRGQPATVRQQERQARAGPLLAALKDQLDTMLR